MRTIGLHILDIIKGTNVVTTKEFLDLSQYWPLEKLEAYQQEKLGKLLTTVVEDVPFYREAVGKDFVPLRPGDFEKFPIVDRTMVFEAGDRLLSDKINLKKCKIGRTGGTTGPPLRIYRDQDTRSFALAAYYRFYDWMGIEPGMPEVELWGSTEITQSKLKTRFRDFVVGQINNFRSYNAFSFNEKYLEGVVNHLQQFKPKLIRGYLSAVLLLADYIKRHNINNINPLAVSTTSETLFPEYRKLIEEIFQAPLFNQYGCGECNGIAFECKEHNGMHVISEHCILESDTENNLIITNLDNSSQPFIRYKNGDIGTISHTSCACGYATPRLTELHGRANENIILKDGSWVNGIFFANLLDETGFINNNKLLRFQVIQNKAGEIEFRCEVKNALQGSELKKLSDALNPFFNMLFISEHDFLEPGPSGKFKYIVSNL